VPVLSTPNKLNTVFVKDKFTSTVILAEPCSVSKQLASGLQVYMVPQTTAWQAACTTVVWFKR